jgi:hypothetical protein
MRLHTGEFTYLTDLKEQLLGNGDRGTTHLKYDLSGSETGTTENAVEKFGRRWQVCQLVQRGSCYPGEV